MRVYAYLDDIFVVCDASSAEFVGQQAGIAMAELGMELKPQKTKIWSVDPAVQLSPSMQQYKVDRMTCLGSTLPFMPSGRSGDEDEHGEGSRMPLLEDVPAMEHMANLRAVKVQIRKLQGAGLSTKAASVIFRTYVNGAITHVLRANLVDEGWCRQWDA